LERATEESRLRVTAVEQNLRGLQDENGPRHHYRSRGNKNRLQASREEITNELRPQEATEKETRQKRRCGVTRNYTFLPAGSLLLYESCDCGAL
jgi:hypothetical protein